MPRFWQTFITRDTSESVLLKVPMLDGETPADAENRMYEIGVDKAMELYAETNPDKSLAWEEDDVAGRPYFSDCWDEETK